MFEKIVEGNGRRHVVENDFEDATDHVALNHDDKRSIVLVSDVAQIDSVVRACW